MKAKLIAEIEITGLPPLVNKLNITNIFYDTIGGNTHFSNRGQSIHIHTVIVKETEREEDEN